MYVAFWITNQTKRRGSCSLLVEPVILVFNSRDINVTQNMINYKCTLPNSKLFTRAIALTPARKPYRIRLQFTHENGDL